jgi:hypothetical protein
MDVTASRPNGPQGWTVPALAMIDPFRSSSNVNGFDEFVP